MDSFREEELLGIEGDLPRGGCSAEESLQGRRLKSVNYYAYCKMNRFRTPTTLVLRVVAVVALPGYPSEFRVETTFSSESLDPLRRNTPEMQELRMGIK